MSARATDSKCSDRNNACGADVAHAHDRRLFFFEAIGVNREVN
jgi:hypothetical protein